MTLVGKGLGKPVALSSDNIVSRPADHISDYLQMALLSKLSCHTWLVLQLDLFSHSQSPKTMRPIILISVVIHSLD